MGRGRIGVGNPGRRFGSRNRMSKRLARAILRDCEGELHELRAAGRHNQGAVIIGAFAVGVTG